MGDRIGLGSIGLGFWGGILAEAVAASGRGAIVSCFARSKEQRGAFSSRFGCKAVSSLDELLADPAVDGVLIATPHSSHRSLIESAAAVGKHVFVEKPLTLTVEDGQAAIDACEAAGVVLQVGHQRRRSPANRRIKLMLEEGQLGDLQLIESHHSWPGGLLMPAEAWRQQPEESPLGSMTSLAVHSLDTFMYFAGPIRQIFAVTRASHGSRTVDQSTVLSVEFESGALGCILTSFFVPDLVRLSVHGEKAAATSEQDGQAISVVRIDQSSTGLEFLPAFDPVEDELTEFVNSVAGETTPETGGREGIAVVAALEAALKSSQTGSAVEISIGG